MDCIVSKGISFTPWKINMEPPNHPFQRKRIFQTSRELCSMLIFRGVTINVLILATKRNTPCSFRVWRLCLGRLRPKGIDIPKNGDMSGQMKRDENPQGWEFPPNGGDWSRESPQNAPKKKIRFRNDRIICPDIYLFWDD